MNTRTQADNPHEPNDPRPEYDPLIDETLRLFASAEPAPGLAERVQSRLVARLQAEPERRILGFPVPSWATERSGDWTVPRRFAASIAAAAVLVAGAAVYSSHRAGTMPPPAARIPAPSSGMAPAGAERLPPKVIQPSIHTRQTGHHTHGRAVISPNHKPLPHGVGVPRSPVPDPDNPPPQQ